MFGILGPLEIGAPGSTCSAGSPRQQAVLAVLLANANTMVPIDVLIEEAWNGRPPPSARRAVHVYVFRLRRILAAQIGEPASHDLLATSDKGYLLRVGPSQLDATSFRQLLTNGQQALVTGDATKAGVLITEALALWRGPALAGVAVESVQQSLVIPLEELRLTALQTKIKAALELGQHESVVPELFALVGAHPLREAFRASLMVALYRSGRQAEALTVYDQARRQLREEFGADPGLALQRLHQAVLRSDPELAALSRPGDVGSQAVPAEAPHVTRVFAGRHAELATLAEISADVRTATSIAVLHGGAGVGKTALAVRFAHLSSRRFADGQLFVDLRGFDPHRAPAPPEEVLGRFLRALGADPERLVGDLDEQSALFRSLMADRQMLIVLDNAADADQIRPLLPGRSSSLVLVTSRSSLADLVAVDDAQPVQVNVLSESEALALLENVLGRRVDQDRAGFAELARRCAYLPLALRIAAALLLGRPTSQVGDLVTDMSKSDPLQALTLSGSSALTSAFDLSCRDLEPETRQLFGRLGLIAGSDIGVQAAAQLAGTDLASAVRSLGVLEAAHLVEQHMPGRYRQHDLLRSYAVSTAAGEPGPEAGHALHRLSYWYAAMVDRAAEAAYPWIAPLMSARVDLDPAFPSFPDDVSANSWLESERVNLTAVVRHASEQGPFPLAWRLADGLLGFHSSRGHVSDWLAAAQAGLRAARQAPDRRAEAAMRHSLGLAQARMGNNRRAVQEYLRALSAYRDLAAFDGQAQVLTALGDTYFRLGRLKTAHDALSQAIAVAVQHRLTRDEAAALGHLGEVYRDLGMLNTSREHLDRALTIFEDLRFPCAGALIEFGLGLIHHDLGQVGPAITRETAALAACQAAGYTAGQAYALRALAAVHRDTGDYDLALEEAQAALALAESVGDAPAIVEVSVELASTYERRGEHAEAARHQRAALRLAKSCGFVRGHAQALLGLAATDLALGRLTRARIHAEHALETSAAGGYRILEADALTVLADLDQREGSHRPALGRCERALTVHRNTGHRLGEARTLAVLGAALQGLGSVEVAYGHWRAARAIFDDLRNPAADQISQLLGAGQAAAGQKMRKVRIPRRGARKAAAITPEQAAARG